MAPGGNLVTVYVNGDSLNTYDDGVVYMSNILTDYNNLGHSATGFTVGNGVVVVLTDRLDDYESYYVNNTISLTAVEPVLKGIFVGTTAPSKIYVGTTEVSEVYKGTTKIRPV